MVGIQYFVNFEVVFHDEVSLLHIVDEVVLRLLVQFESYYIGACQLVDFLLCEIDAVLLELKHHYFLGLPVLFHIE